MNPHNIDPASWFDDVPVIGKLSHQEMVAALRELGDNETADAVEAANSPFESTVKSLFQPKPWQHTSYAFGYLPTNTAGQSEIPIQHSGTVTPDLTLKNSQIKITLDCLRIASYPGGGTHQILFDFYAQNQLSGNVEHLHFNNTYRVQEGQRAAILGYPIFIGLNVGNEGVAFKCFTVNVKNSQDESFLGFLDSDVFKSGLKLASALQPAIGPLSQMALGITKSIATHNNNKAVQEFYLGLDFSNVATRARLAEGSYLAVQIPESSEAIWDWSKWVYNPTNGQVTNKDNPQRLIPFNYIVFSISRYQEA